MKKGITDSQKLYALSSSGAKSINYLKIEQNLVNVYTVYATDG
jgi:hypothetical protein